MPNVKTSITEKKKLMTKTYNSDLSRYLKEKNSQKVLEKHIIWQITRKENGKTTMNYHLSLVSITNIKHLITRQCQEYRITRRLENCWWECKVTHSL